MPNSGLKQSHAAARRKALTREERRNGKHLAQQGYEHYETEHSGGDRQRGIGLTAQEMKRAALARGSAEEG